MVTRIRHNATVEELEKSVADIEESIAILDELLQRTPQNWGTPTELIGISLVGEYQAQRYDLINRKNEILQQIQRRKNDA